MAQILEWTMALKWNDGPQVLYYGDTHVKKGLSKNFDLIMNSLKFSIIDRGFTMVISGYPKNARF